jgi:hypothetical protein
LRKLDSAGFAPRIVQVSEAIRVGELVSERLSWKQICERYPDAWVVLVDIQWSTRVRHRDRARPLQELQGGLASHQGRVPALPRGRIFWTGPIRGLIPRFVLP